MKSEQNPSIDKKKSSLRSKIFAAKVIAIPLIVLTSCAPNLEKSVKNLNIYQPSTLRLEKNKPVQTLDGVYTPQENEVWHSDARFRRLERELY